MQQKINTPKEKQSINKTDFAMSPRKAKELTQKRLKQQRQKRKQEDE
jgi:hypothetical protein